MKRGCIFSTMNLVVNMHQDFPYQKYLVLYLCEKPVKLAIHLPLEQITMCSVKIQVIQIAIYSLKYFRHLLSRTNKRIRKEYFSMLTITLQICTSHWTTTSCEISIIMLSVNFFCNISSYDIFAYITKNYIALIYYAKIVHLLCQFPARKVGFSAVCQAIYS